MSGVHENLFVSFEKDNGHKSRWNVVACARMDWGSDWNGLGS